MSPSNPLPASDSHHQFHVSVVASQLEFPRNNPTLLQPMFLISINVFAYPENFYSNQETFPGLTKYCISQDLFSVPCYKLTSPQFAKETVLNLLDQMFVPFGLNQVTWRQRHLDGEYKLLKNVDNLCMKISDFACSMRQQIYNAGHNILPFQLSVVKMAKVPIYQLKSKTSCNSENIVARPDFEEEEEEDLGAISSPRNSDELFYDANADFDLATESFAGNLGDKLMNMTLGTLT